MGRQSHHGFGAVALFLFCLFTVLEIHDAMAAPGHGAACAPWHAAPQGGAAAQSATVTEQTTSGPQSLFGGLTSAASRAVQSIFSFVRNRLEGPSDDDGDNGDPAPIEEEPEPCTDARCWVIATMNFVFDSIAAATSNPTEMWLNVWLWLKNLAYKSVPLLTVGFGAILTFVFMNFVAWAWEQCELFIRIFLTILFFILRMPLFRVVWKVLSWLGTIALDMSGFKPVITRRTRALSRALATIEESEGESQPVSQDSQPQRVPDTSAQVEATPTPPDQGEAGPSSGPNAQAETTRPTDQPGVVPTPAVEGAPLVAVEQAVSTAPVSAVRQAGGRQQQVSAAAPEATDHRLASLMEKMMVTLSAVAGKVLGNNVPDSDKPYCTHCHRTGHTRGNCWALADLEGRPRLNTRPARKANSLASVPEEPTVTPSPDCSVVRASMPCTLVHAPCWVNGVRVPRCLVDTGAEVNVMALKTTMKLGLSYEPGAVQSLAGFTGALSGVMGVTECKMRFSPSEETKVVEFLVVKNLSDGPIIGFPTLQSFGLMVDCVLPGLVHKESGRVAHCSAVSRPRKN